MIEISTVSRRRSLTLTGFMVILTATASVATGVSQYRIVTIEPMLASMLSRPHNPTASDDKIANGSVVFRHPHDPFAPGGTALARETSGSQTPAPALAGRLQQHQMIANRFPALLAQQAAAQGTLLQPAQDTTTFADSGVHHCGFPPGVKPDIQDRAETNQEPVPRS